MRRPGSSRVALAWLGLAAAAASSFSSASTAAPAAAPSPADGPAVPPAEKILSTLHPGHPRVMVRAETFADIRALVARGGLPAHIYGEVKKNAEALLEAAPVNYEKPDGRRLLQVSRRVVDRMRTLGLVHWLDGDPRMADRAWRELEAAARFPDWSPSHFLDTAEMTHAFALG